MGKTHWPVGSTRKPAPLGSGVVPRAKEGSSELQGDPPSPFFFPRTSTRPFHTSALCDPNQLLALPPGSAIIKEASPAVGFNRPSRAQEFFHDALSHDPVAGLLIAAPPMRQTTRRSPSAGTGSRSSRSSPARARASSSTRTPSRRSAAKRRGRPRPDAATCTTTIPRSA